MASPGDLQPPLLAVGQGVRLLPGNVAEVHLRQQLFHPLALPRLLLPVQMEGRSEEIARRTAVHGRQHVVEHRLVLPQTDILEGPGHAHPGDLVRGGGQGVGVLPGVLALVELAHLALGVVFHDLLPPVPHRAVGGLVHAGDDVEGRSLARAVGADQGDDLPLAYLQIHVVHGDDAAELHGDILQTKDLLTHFAASFFFDFPERRARRLRATSESSRSPMSRGGEQHHDH